MRNHMWTKAMSMMLVLVLVIGLLPATTLTALAAVNVSGTVNAGQLSANAELNLTGDTTIAMDKDLTLSSISGKDYHLTVQGSGKLTVNGSGSVNMGDFSRGYAHVRRTAPITDEYLLRCGDVVADGSINMGDLSQIYAHVRGAQTLY